MRGGSGSIGDLGGHNKGLTTSWRDTESDSKIDVRQGNDGGKRRIKGLRKSVFARDDDIRRGTMAPETHTRIAINSVP